MALLVMPLVQGMQTGGTEAIECCPVGTVLGECREGRKVPRHHVRTGEGRGTDVWDLEEIFSETKKRCGRIL